MDRGGKTGENAGAGPSHNPGAAANPAGRASFRGIFTCLGGVFSPMTEIS